MTGPATGEPDRGTERRRRCGLREPRAASSLILLRSGSPSGSSSHTSCSRLRLRASTSTSFRFWANNLAAHGPGGFYARGFFVDYTPGYLYVLWLVGIVGSALGRGIGDLIKLPAILADLAVGWPHLVAGRASSAARRRAALLGGRACTSSTRSPGSTASSGARSIRFGARLPPARRARPVARPARSGRRSAVTVAAIDQAAARASSSRSWPRSSSGATCSTGSGPVERPADRRSRGAGWLGSTRVRSGSSRAGVAAGTAALLVGAVRACRSRPHRPGRQDRRRLSVPDGQRLQPVGARHAGRQRARAERPVAAATITGPRPHAVPAGSTLIGPIPAVFVGTACSSRSILVGVLVARRETGGRSWSALAVLAIAFFVVPTRVHERYMFPFFALGAILAAVSCRWRVAYLVLAVATFANMYVGPDHALPEQPADRRLAGHRPTPSASQAGSRSPPSRTRGRPVGPGRAPPRALRSSSTPSRRPSALDRARPAAGGLDRRCARPRRPTGCAAPWMPRRRARALAAWRRRPRSAGSRPAGRAAGPRADRRRPRSATAGDGPTGGAGRRSTGPARSPESPLLGRRLTPRPRVPTAPRLLHGERGGRLDRLDLLILVVLVVRRPDPAHCCGSPSPYDALRRGLPRPDGDRVPAGLAATACPTTIYECTHPHLAKYAMAAGIACFGRQPGHRHERPRRAGHAVRRSSRAGTTRGLPDERAGDRLYVATAATRSGVYDLADARAHRHVRRSRAPGAGRRHDRPPALRRARRRRDRRRSTRPASSTRCAQPTPPPQPDRHDSTDPRQRRGRDRRSCGSATTARRSSPARHGGRRRLDPVDGDRAARCTSTALADLAAAAAPTALVAAPAAVDRPGRRGEDAGRPDGGGRGRRRGDARGRSPSDRRRPGRRSARSRTRRDVDRRAIADGQPGRLRVPAAARRGRRGHRRASRSSSSRRRRVTATVPTSGRRTGLALRRAASTRRALRGRPTARRSQLSLDDPVDGDDPRRQVVETTITMPGQVSKVTFDAATKMVHVLGRTPDGSADHGLRRRAPRATPRLRRRPAARSRPWPGRSTRSHDYPSPTARPLLASRPTARSPASTSGATRSPGASRASSWAR